MASDPNYPAINMSDFKECNCMDLYGELKEDTPPNAPEEMGNEVDLRG